MESLNKAKLNAVPPPDAEPEEGVTGEGKQLDLPVDLPETDPRFIRPEKKIPSPFDILKIPRDPDALDDEADSD